LKVGDSDKRFIEQAPALHLNVVDGALAGELLYDMMG